jgi:hypothetical protein
VVFKIIDTILGIGSLVFTTLLYAAGALVIMANPDLLTKFIGDMVQTPIIQNFSWLVLLTGFLYLLNKLWSPLRLFAVTIISRFA